MRRYFSSLAAVLCAAPLAYAQAGPRDPSAFIPRYTIALGYNNIRANAPPANCGCFDTNGGFASGAVELKYGLSVAGEVTANHATDISPIGQNLSLITAGLGPQATFRATHFVTYAQFLLGGAYGTHSYFPLGDSYSTAAKGFAFSTGGGVDYHLNHLIAIRLVEAQFLHTSLRNGSSNEQNQLMLGAGIVFKFHGHYAQPHATKSRPEPSMWTPPTAAAMPEPAPAPLPPPPVNPPQPSPADAAEARHDLGQVFFDYDSAELRPTAQEAIRDTTDFLMLHPEVDLVIGGYADERGTVEYNLTLSKRRADALAAALMNHGIAATRVRVIAYGKGTEVCQDQDQACWQANRRATMVAQSR